MALINVKTLHSCVRQSCFIFILLLLVSCDNGGDAPATVSSPEVNTAPIDPAATTATDSAWQHGEQLLQGCIADAEALRENVRQFLAEPNTDTLTQSRQRWHQAHNHILGFSVFFTLANTNPGLFGELVDYRYNLDAYPVQPGFIDYFDVYQFSGIVNDIAITLGAEALREQHGITDVSDVSIGFHAMEYLLWGEHGERLIDDFIAQDALSGEQSQQGLRVVDLPNNRRRVYLQLLTELLVDDCRRLAEFWRNPNQNVYNNYQNLQTPTRLQLWQAAIDDLITEMETALTPVAITTDGDVAGSPTAAEESETLTDQTESTEQLIAHNHFANREPQVIAAQLRGLGLLLYGNADPEQQNLDTQQPLDAQHSLDTHLAPWISTQPKPAADTPALLVALRDEFNRIVNSLSEQTGWPLPDSDNAALQDLLRQLRTAITTTPQTTTTPQVDNQDPEESPPSP